MTSMSNMSMTLAEFERLLDVYGADRARWPAEARAAAAQLVAKDADAQRLLAETEALDRVLQNAPVPALAAEAALAERIVAAAQRSPRMVKLPAAPPGAAPLRAAAPPGNDTGRPRHDAGQGARPGLRRVRLLGREAGAAGLLVASLVIGVVIGQSQLPPQVLPALADIAGLSPDRDELVQIALSDEVVQ
jgi:hypothetical protein